MDRRSARHLVCDSIIEPLEERRFFSVAAGATTTLPSTSSGGGGTVISPIPPEPAPNDTTVPVTINAAAGTEFSGSVGRLKNVTIAATLQLDALIDWGDGTSSAGTIKQVAVGTLQINGKHTWKYGGTYPVSVSVSGHPVGAPGEPVPMYIVVFATIQSKAIVTGPLPPPAPKPITGTGVILNLTAGKPFTGSVGSFKLNVPTVTGVLGAGIDWGDGAVSAGTLTKQADGSYKVIGTHTYQAGGEYKIVTTISAGPPIGPGPRPLYPTRLLGTIHSTAKVAPAPTPPDGTVTLVDGVLDVRGTDQADQIDITETSPYVATPVVTNTAGGTIDVVTPPLNPLPPMIYVTINGHSHVFKATGVKSVTVEGLAGDDAINLHGYPPVPIIYADPVAGAPSGGVSATPIAYPFNIALRVAAIVHGGGGNDTITGGNANDTLYGDAGNDALNGEQGTDVLLGGAGDDRLTSSAGNDKAFGGDGEDTAILAVIPFGIANPNGPFPQVYPFGYIDEDIEHFLAPPVVKPPTPTPGK